MRIGRCKSLLPAFEDRSVLQTFRRTVFFLILIAFILFIPSIGAAQSVPASQDDVEASYLFNFVKFTQWPGEVHIAALNICVLGQDPFGASLDRVVAGERIDGHPLTVTRLADTGGIHSCAMVFIADSEAPRLAEEMSSLATLPVMTVSDMPGFLDQGGMIQFVLKEDQVRFMVNLNATGKCGLILSSQLLKVAVTVVDTSQPKAAK